MDFTSSVETIDDVTRRVTVSIPAERVSKAMEETVQGFVKHTPVKGFRAGKAPRQMVEKMHGDRIRVEVANRLISSSLSDVVKEHKLDMVGSPSVDISAFDPGKEMKFTADISLYPRPEITGYDKFDVKIVKREPTNDDIERVIQGMRESKATVRPNAFRQTAQKGDVAETLVGVEVEGEESARPEPVSIELGSGKFPAVLEEGIVGMTVGDSKVLETALEENHPNEKLRGKKAKYSVTLNGLSEKILPEADDALAKSLNFGVETFLELRLKIRERLEQELQRDMKAEVQTEILNQLVDRNQFPVPQVMIDEEIRSLLVRAGLLDPSKIDPQQIPVDQFRDKLGDTALRRVRTAIVVDRIGQIEKIGVEAADVDAAIADIAQKNGVSVEDVRKFLLRGDQADGLRLEIGRNKVLEFLEKRATVEHTDAPVEGKEEKKGKK